MKWLDRWFHLSERATTPRREVIGGVTTFATMAYIIVVNPAILAEAGIDRDAGTIATILAAVFGTLLMGLYANRPIAVAPYMGENAFIAFGLTAYAITWQQRLGTVFVSGLLFLALTLLGARAWLANAIPASLKHSFAAGIGLFLLFLGLNEAGLVAVNIAAAPLKIGAWGTPQLLAIAGFLVMAWLLHLGVRGAILIGIALSAAAGIALGLADTPTQIVDLPWNHDLSKIAGQLDIPGVLRLELAPILFTLFLMSFLDTLGTLYALGSAGHMLDAQGRFPDVEKPMLVDSLACMFSALVGTSTSGAYIESATGIRDGARTGLAAVVTALCFALALFFVPLVGPMQQLTFAYAPALMIVGVLMFGAARCIDFDDLTEAAPALATIALMVFTMNIANGLAAGLVLHPLLKALTGQWRAIHPGTALLGAAAACYYLFGTPH
jgi:AGZA family xanthine/uracil permease-like MFS transporter